MTDEEREDLNTFKHDLIKQARWWQWKAETLEKENEQLKAENAALKEKLEKAVELPCKIGDRFYIVEYYPPEIIEEECCDFSFIELSKILLDNGCGVTYELGDNGCFFVTLDKNEAIRIYNQKKGGTK